MKTKSLKTNTKPVEKLDWSCIDCNVFFKTKKRMYKHMKKYTHYTCIDCKIKFGNLIEFCTHLKSKKHMEAWVSKTRVLKKLDPFLCLECDARFSSKKLLRAHKKTHQTKKQKEVKIKEGQYRKRYQEQALFEFTFTSVKLVWNLLAKITNGRGFPYEKGYFSVMDVMKKDLKSMRDNPDLGDIKDRDMIRMYARILAMRPIRQFKLIRKKDRLFQILTNPTDYHTLFMEHPKEMESCYIFYRDFYLKKIDEYFDQRQGAA